MFSSKVKKIVTARLIAALTLNSLFAGSFSGCGLRVPNFAVLPSSESSWAVLTANNKVDILWVIDNSGTMGPKQTNLANSINSFMNQFITKGMDYQIAVVTTDVRPVDPLAPNDPNRSGQGACFVGSPKIITPQTPNPVNALAANANVGFFGSADAHGLDAVQMALSEPNISGCNAGFLRSDAFLAVIEFSDADDNTSATVSGLLAALDVIRPPMTLSNGRVVRSYFFSSMVVDDLTKPECIALGPFSEKGLKFLDIATQTSGTIASICDPDFSAGLLSVSTKILEQATAVRLKYIPDVSTIVVYENENSVNQDATNGWTFDAATNSVIFHGSAIPVQGMLLTVTYTPNDIVR